MGGGTRVVAAGETGREPLVVGLDGGLDAGAQAVDECVGLARLLAVLAAQGQRHADDDELGRFRGDHREQLRKTGVGGGAFNRRDRARHRSRGIGDRDARARGAEVQREHFQLMAAVSLSRPASSASRTAPTFFPPASARFGRPPPPPPMIGPSSRTIATASTPATDLSRFTTSATLPSSADASTTASASSRWRT